MATISRSAMKLLAIAGSVPAVGVAIGYRMRAVQAADRVEGSRVFRACDLPLYPTSNKNTQSDNKDPYPRNVIEEQIGVVRKAVMGFLSNFKDTYDSIDSKARIGAEHTKASLDYVQNNPGELPRVIFICVAGMGGMVLAYRGGVFRKVIYSTVAATSCAALCYPKKTVELSNIVLDEGKSLWVKSGGQSLVDQYWPYSEEEQKEDTPSKSSVKKTKMDLGTEAGVSKSLRPSNIADDKKQVKKDYGQSNPKDKDMYSTR